MNWRGVANAVDTLSHCRRFEIVYTKNHKNLIHRMVRKLNLFLVVFPSLNSHVFVKSFVIIRYVWMISTKTNELEQKMALQKKKTHVDQIKIQLCVLRWRNLSKKIWLVIIYWLHRKCVHAYLHTYNRMFQISTYLGIQIRIKNQTFWCRGNIFRVHKSLKPYTHAVPDVRKWNLSDVLKLQQFRIFEKWITLVKNEIKNADCTCCGECVSVLNSRNHTRGLPI